MAFALRKYLVGTMVPYCQLLIHGTAITLSPVLEKQTVA